MRIRSRQLLLAVILIAPAVWTVMVTPPFVAPVAAQSAGGGMLGPNAPIMAGSSSFYPTSLGGGFYRMNSPWDCNTGDKDDEVEMSGGAPFDTAMRMNETKRQELRIESLTGGRATGFEYDDSSGGVGDAELVDLDMDMAYDMLMGTGQRGGGTPFGISFSFVFMDENSDMHPDHVSVPWSQVHGMGWVAGSDGCHDTEPQVWVPLADTDSDGFPDSIVFDLNGDNVPDPEFYPGGRMVAVMAVPTLDWLGLTLLAALLSGLSLWVLSRREAGQSAS